MLKKSSILSLMMAILLVLATVVPSTAQSKTMDPDKEIYTSYCKENYIDMEIQGSNLIISGIISTGFKQDFWIMVYIGDISETMKITPKKYFTESINLKEVSEKTNVEIYSKGVNSEIYNGFIYHNIYIEKDDSDNFKFYNSPVLLNNLEKSKIWINPADGLNNTIPIEIKTLSDNITKGIDSDYEKIFALYDWVVKNVSYDFDVFYGKAEYKTDSLDVLHDRKSVCAGYANLLQSLIQAQNIPCINTSTYSLGISTNGEWDDDNVAVMSSNHAHNEAFVEGRWIAMDSTWDSRNRYENGKFDLKEPNCYVYFDVSNEFLAGSHKIINRDIASRENVPSSWAQDEVSTAVTSNLVPFNLQNNYRNNITRKEFCQLIVTMLQAKNNTDVNGLLNLYRTEKSESAFTDTSDKSVITATTLGIVNGRGNNKFAPDAYITRQEAASIIKRCAELMKINSTSGANTQFDDSASFSSWAKEPISYVSTLQNNEGKVIMGGPGHNRFSPNGSYTREQAILTVLRLSECLEDH